MNIKKALLIVDVQNDFCAGGTLAVPQANTIIPVLNKYIHKFHKAELPIFAVRDWHPIKTSHFKEFGGEWPIHCVKDTKGAQFHPDLELPQDTYFLYKGMEPDNNSFSAFHSKDTHNIRLHAILTLLKISELYVGGLATDYCVKFSVLDAVKFNYRVNLLSDAIKGVNIQPQDSEKAINEMINFGVKSITFGQLDI